MNRACFPEEKTPEFTKMCEIHELFVLAFSLVWFAGATPEPSHNKPSHPRVPSWAILLSEGFQGSVRATPSQELATLVLKRRMGVRGSTQGPPLGGQIPPKLTSDRPALI